VLCQDEGRAGLIFALLRPFQISEAAFLVFLIFFAVTSQFFNILFIYFSLVDLK